MRSRCFTSVQSIIALTAGNLGCSAYFLYRSFLPLLAVCDKSSLFPGPSSKGYYHPVKEHLLCIVRNPEHNGFDRVPHSHMKSPFSFWRINN